MTKRKKTKLKNFTRRLEKIEEFLESGIDVVIEAPTRAERAAFYDEATMVIAQLANSISILLPAFDEDDEEYSEEEPEEQPKATPDNQAKGAKVFQFPQGTARATS